MTDAATVLHAAVCVGGIAVSSPCVRRRSQRAPSRRLASCIAEASCTSKGSSACSLSTFRPPPIIIRALAPRMCAALTTILVLGSAGECARTVASRPRITHCRGCHHLLPPSHHLALPGTLTTTLTVCPVAHNAIGAASIASVGRDDVWLNELHYDNTGRVSAPAYSAFALLLICTSLRIETLLSQPPQ